MIIVIINIELVETQQILYKNPFVSKFYINIEYNLFLVSCSTISNVKKQMLEKMKIAFCYQIKENLNGRIVLTL